MEGRVTSGPHRPGQGQQKPSSQFSSGSPTCPVVTCRRLSSPADSLSASVTHPKNHSSQACCPSYAQISLFFLCLLSAPGWLGDGGCCQDSCQWGLTHSLFDNCHRGFPITLDCLYVSLMSPLARLMSISDFTGPELNSWASIAALMSDLMGLAQSHVLNSHCICSVSQFVVGRIWMFHVSRPCFVLPLEGRWHPQPVETILPSLLCLSSVAAGAPTSLTPSGSYPLSVWQLPPGFPHHLGLFVCLFDVSTRKAHEHLRLHRSRAELLSFHCSPHVWLDGAEALEPPWHHCLSQTYIQSSGKSCVSGCPESWWGHVAVKTGFEWHNNKSIQMLLIKSPGREFDNLYKENVLGT